MLEDGEAIMAGPDMMQSRTALWESSLWSANLLYLGLHVGGKDQELMNDFCHVVHSRI